MIVINSNDIHCNNATNYNNKTNNHNNDNNDSARVGDQLRLTVSELRRWTALGMVRHLVGRVLITIIIIIIIVIIMFMIVTVIIFIITYVFVIIASIVVNTSVIIITNNIMSIVTRELPEPFLFLVGERQMLMVLVFIYCLVSIQLILHMRTKKCQS